MKILIDYTKSGMRNVNRICEKYGIPPKMTINGSWVHELTKEQYKSLGLAEKNGYLKRTIL